MEYYFEIPNDRKKYRGRRRITLPVKIDSEIRNAYNVDNNFPISQFKSIDDLMQLKVYV